MILSDSVELVVVSFALLLNQLLVFGDLSAKGFNRNVLFEELVSESVDLFFDVKSILLAIGHDALSSGFLKLFAGSHFAHLFLRRQLKLEQLILKQVVLGNKHFKIATVLTAVLFAHKSQVLNLTLLFIQ